MEQIEYQKKGGQRPSATLNDGNKKLTEKASNEPGSAEAQVWENEQTVDNL